jgi:hypothetical protein
MGYNVSMNYLVNEAIRHLEVFGERDLVTSRYLLASPLPELADLFTTRYEQPTQLYPTTVHSTDLFTGHE